MGRPMGLDFGLEKNTSCIKRKFRWILIIPGVSADDSINALPPAKSARPNLSFKETNVQHMNEVIWYPMKPEWKPISLSLYDLKKNQNPIFAWFRRLYDPCSGAFNPSVGIQFKQNATLKMLDGCGDTLETWVYENAWPQTLEWGELDMSSSEYTTIDLTLRYDRAFIEEEIDCGSS